MVPSEVFIMTSNTTPSPLQHPRKTVVFTSTKTIVWLISSHDYITAAMTALRRALFVLPKVGGDGGVFISIGEKTIFCRDVREKKIMSRMTGGFHWSIVPRGSQSERPNPKGSAGARTAPNSNRENVRHLPLLSCRGLVIAFFEPTIGVKC